MDIDEKRISDFAYYIWQSEGEPEGEHQRHWEKARVMAEAEGSAAPAHIEESFPGDVQDGNDTEQKPRDPRSTDPLDADGSVIPIKQSATETTRSEDDLPLHGTGEAPVESGNER